MLASLLLGFFMAATYYKTQEAENYQQNFAITLLMLPVILSVIILFIGSNIARAFSLGGTLSIIRFRSAPGDPKDIGYIFFDIASGLACGVGMYGYGALFVLMLCVILILSKKYNFFRQRSERKILRITAPEDLSSGKTFESVLDKFAKEYKLSRIKTTDLGSLYEFTYNISLKPDAKELELIDEIRLRNGNLTIMISEMPQIIK